MVYGKVINGYEAKVIFAKVVIIATSWTSVMTGMVDGRRSPKITRTKNFLSTHTGRVALRESESLGFSFVCQVSISINMRWTCG